LLPAFFIEPLRYNAQPLGKATKCPQVSRREFLIMINPVAVQYMSKEEIERLMYSFNASKDNDEAQTFEALVRRLLTIIEEQNR
jgi:hypothetical protein